MNDKNHGARFIPYSQIAHRDRRKANPTDTMTAEQIKHYIADKL